MFHGIPTHEVVYGFLRPNIFRVSKTFQRPEHFMQTFQDFASMLKHVNEATWHIFITISFTDQI